MEGQESIINFYSNDTELAMGAYDISINYTCNTPDGPLPERIRATMSLQHAKKLAKALDEQIKIYEELYGALNVDPDPETVKKLIAEGKINVKSQD